MWRRGIQILSAWQTHAIGLAWVPHVRVRPTSIQQCVRQAKREEQRIHSRRHGFPPHWSHMSSNAQLDSRSMNACCFIFFSFPMLGGSSPFSWCGNWMSGFFGFNDFPTNMHAKLAVICHGLHTVVEMGACCVYVETDSLEVVHLIDRGNTSIHVFRVLLDDINMCTWDDPSEEDYIALLTNYASLVFVRN